MEGGGCKEMTGKFVEITTENIFGDPVKTKGTILGEKTHGYDFPYDSWGLYPGKPEEGAIPAMFIIFRKYKKKKPMAINKKRIIKIEEV